MEVAIKLERGPQCLPERKHGGDREGTPGPSSASSSAIEGVSSSQTTAYEAAWDPAALIPMPDVGSYFPKPPVIPRPETRVGESEFPSLKHFDPLTWRADWMMDKRFRNKRMDVRLKATGKMHGGLYDDKDGHITVTNKTKLTKRDPMLKVVVGFHAVNRQFRLPCIQPERTTEKERLVGPGTLIPAVPISRAPGTQVIIIGPDKYGNEGYVGLYGVISATRGAEPGDTWVAILSGQGHDGLQLWMHELSLCRVSPFREYIHDGVHLVSKY